MDSGSALFLIQNSCRSYSTLEIISITTGLPSRYFPKQNHGIHISSRSNDPIILLNQYLNLIGALSSTSQNTTVSWREK